MKGLKKGRLERIDALCVNSNLKKLARSVTVIYDRRLTRHNITANQFGILSYIFYYDSVTLGVLADKLGMDRTTLSKNLKPMFRDRLIQEVPSDDKRQKVLALTGGGKKTLAASLKSWRAAQKDVYRRYGKKEIHSLLLLLHEILGAHPLGEE